MSDDDSSPDPERLAHRLEVLEETAARAEQSLSTARRAMQDVADLCDVDVPRDPDAESFENAQTAAARAEVSLDAAADELERISAALRAVTRSSSAE